MCRGPIGDVEMPDVPDDRKVERRDFLCWCAAAGGASILGLAGTGCAPGPGGDGAVAVALSDLPAGKRVRVRWRDRPVEVLRSGDDVRAMSLVCTHFSCTVHWDVSEDRYVCPCHQGRFDAEGQPVSGPPTEPLVRVPVKVVDGTVWVGRT
jgi:cytochrome b6-f complex iron-sulfur subunit